MTRYTSRADLLIAAGESIKMQMNAGVNEPAVKYMGKITACDELNYTNPQLCEYEFPLSVVEGKPVFSGDKLYSPLGMRFIVDENGMPFCPNTCSWSQPKPKTVMVPLLLEDAEYLAGFAEADCICQVRNIANTCRKALEKA